MLRSHLPSPVSCRLAAMLASVLLLSACGGGGSSGGGSTVAVDGPAPTTPPTTPPATPPGGGTVTPPTGGPGGGTGTPPGGGGGPTLPPIPGPAAQPPVLATITGVRALATNPGDGTLYAVDADGMLWRKTTEEQAAQPIYSLGLAHVEGLAFSGSANQLFLSVNGTRLGRFRLDDSTFVDVGAFPGFTSVKGLEVDGLSGRLYGVDAGTRTLLEIDRATAAVTAIGTLPSAYAQVEGLAMDPVGRALYGADLATGKLLEIRVTDAAVVERTRLPRAQSAGLGYVVTGDRFVVADAATGDIVLWDAKGHDIQLSSVKGLDYDATARRLVGVHQGQAMLVAIDPLSGWTSWIGWVGVGGIESLGVDSAGRVAYGVDNGRKVLVRIDLATGQGVDVGPLSGAAGASSDVAGLAFDPASGVLFGVDASTGSVVRIAPATGAVTVAAAAGLVGVRSLAFEPGRRALHAFDDAVRMHLTVDAQTFAVSQEPVPAFGPVGGLAFDSEHGILWGVDLPSGTVVRVWQEPVAPSLGYDDVTAMAQVGAQFVAYDQATDTLVTVDPATGAGSLMAQLGAFDIEALTVDPTSGHLLASDIRSGNLLRIEPGSGAVSLVGALAYGEIRGLAFDPTSGVLYGVDRVSRSLVAINPASGAATLRMDLTPHGLSDLQDLVFDPATQRLIAVDAAQRRLVEIDPAGLTVSEIGVIEPADVRAMVVESPGVLAVIDRETDRLVRLDRFTGATLP